LLRLTYKQLADFFPQGRFGRFSARYFDFEREKERKGCGEKAGDKTIRIETSVADPGSGALLTPGSGIRNRFFPDPRSRISEPGSQTHILESLVTISWVKFFQHFHFEKFMTKKV